MHGVVGVVAQPQQAEQARRLAQRLGLNFLHQPPSSGLMLAVTPARLELREAGSPATRPVFVDFNSADVKKRLSAGKRGNLARAVGASKRPGLTVFDATCGLGRDTGVLLGLGCRVFACERHPVLQALLEDGLVRAGPPDNWQELITHDAVEWLATQTAAVADVIYLDPMFGDNRNALPKWELQALHEIVGNDSDAGALLSMARRRAGRRVVVKRHPRAPSLAPPDLQIRGRRSRFDIYLITEKDFK